MTHIRAPLTFAGAMTQVAGLIGYPTAAKIAGRAERTVYAWAHPTSKTVPPIDQALAFDAAWREAGGAGAPFLDAFAFQLGLVIERQDACARALVADVSNVSRETGEAIAAALSLTNSNASPLDAHRAFAEVTQAGAAIDALQQRVASFLRSGAGPGAGLTGVTR
ncbi:hypothetical protein [Sphingomonas sp. 8AM]|uniref:hypothetical protein n=1 Tax=Sphingomonas sp. 8AM TaxID=2653170 RepID=UPI0012F206C4|nr:hypothetical protein [Sphingomonas sp. 8AM]VXC80085.1 conserved hypothetical protein [Sphingomonas sp. 8AM]